MTGYIVIWNDKEDVGSRGKNFGTFEHAYMFYQEIISKDSTLVAKLRLFNDIMKYEMSEDF